MMYLDDGTGRQAPRNIDRPSFGLLEWFHVGDEQRVEDVLADAAALGITELRTGISWADFVTKEGPDWYDWLLPRLREQVNLLPCFTYTPPSEGIVPKVSAPPREPKKFADFLDVAISRYGEHFEWLELWNEPNGLVDYDWRLDPDWKIFSEMIVMAAYWAKQRNKKTVLGGMCPTDPNWLNMMCERNVLENIDVVGIHGFPSTWEFDWSDWDENIARVQEVLDRHRLDCKIWITEVGYSTWRHDEFNQLLHFNQVMRAPVDRVYWYSVRNLRPDRAHQEGFRQDERHYHLGLKTASGTPKLLFRILEGEGLDGPRNLAALAKTALPQVFTTPMTTQNGNQLMNSIPSTSRNGTGKRYSLITGGAGFVGINLADRLLSRGKRVMIFDNLSRPGVERNLRWLQKKHPQNLNVEIADVRNRYLLQAAVLGASEVFHFAAQVAVTTSLTDPESDFEINARGTLNLLEALRELPAPPPLLFTSTNKVYGPLDHFHLQQEKSRYEPENSELRQHGISEACGLHFQSPYGCSKGTADQYVLDYAASFGLPAVVFRMSCIYGPHQFGTEDQGWVAHFLMRALREKPITIYGDGRQVRDILFVDDLLDAMEAAMAHIGKIQGQAFNIGGGTENRISLLELISEMDRMIGRKTEFTFSEWRPADQSYYVSDIRRFNRATGWSPKTNIRIGLEQLLRWLELEFTPPLKHTQARKTRFPGARSRTISSKRALNP